MSLVNKDENIPPTVFQIAEHRVKNAEEKPSIDHVLFAEKFVLQCRLERKTDEQKAKYSELCLRLAKVRDSLSQ